MARAASQPNAGFTLVELLVACAIGLGVAAVALSLYARQVRAQREQLVQARLHQDLGAAADLMVRGLRRAGHRGLTHGAGANPYRAIEVSDSSVEFSHTRDAVEDDRLDARERAGFRLAGGALQAQVGGRWQALTDPTVVTIDHFDIAIEERRAPSGCASVVTRGLRIELQASTTDSAEPTTRRLQAFVGVRNPDIDETAC